jgi:hypothetical protein
MGLRNILHQAFLSDTWSRFWESFTLPAARILINKIGRFTKHIKQYDTTSIILLSTIYSLYAELGKLL